MKYTLTITESDYTTLRQHLFPGDGNEAVAMAICGRQASDEQTRLLVHEIILIPYEDCQIREPHLVKWSTKSFIPSLEKAARKDLAILKIHSHPTGFRQFSEVDDISDAELFESVFGWMDNDNVHASAVMLPDGEIFGRIFLESLNTKPLDRITIVGHNIISWANTNNEEIPEYALRTAQAFGEGTTKKLGQLRIGVVGCSGTGSPLIEQLVRLGVGELILVDPDKVENKNLNRIVNTKASDAEKELYKVDVLHNAINSIGLGTQVQAYRENIYESIDVINKLAGCDILFGCVDSVDGRHLLNQIATFYLVPYFDLGVKLTSDGKGGIDQIMGTIHYLLPGGSSLRTRGVYTDEDLRAAAMYRTDKEYYEEQKKSGYIVDVTVDSPAVISINMQIASMAVNEFLARLHPYRYESNSEFAIYRISFSDAYIQYESDGDPDPYLMKFKGRGDLLPLLNMPEFN
ncbi:MAG: ThiF family adenylyltransferase [Crocinitomicaceae bacterium]|nr:ThiF family adenylyltransferase [Crocinitomicaceae bacterium]